MLALPDATAFRRPLPKAQLYRQFDLRAAQRAAIDADIARLDFVHVVAPHTLPALAAGREVQAVAVVEVTLRRADFAPQGVALLARLIPQRIVFALRHGGRLRLAVWHTQLLLSPWMDEADAALPLCGPTLDDAWRHIVAHVGGLDAQSDVPLADQIAERDRRDRVLRQIEALERRCRAERQTRRQYELYQEIIKHKKLL